MQVNSDNSQASLFDQLSLDVEAFRSQIIESLASSVVDYTQRCQESKMENSRESFMEFMKFTAATAENTKVSAGRVQSIISSGGGGKNAKPQSDDEIAMIAKLRRGTWDWNWKPDRCQKFSVTGGKKYTFCGANVPKNSYFCTDCIKLKTIIKIKAENPDFDPEAWKKTKIASVFKKYSIESADGDSAPTTEKKVVKQAPPPAKSAGADAVAPRAYKGKGVEPGGTYSWIHVDQQMGGFVIDADNNLIGVSRVCGPHGNVVPATEAQQRRFETMAKRIPSNSTRVTQSEKPTSVLRAPTMPKTVKKQKSESEEEEEEEVSLEGVITDGEDTD